MAPPPRGDFEEIRWGIPQNVKSFPVALRTNRCESDHALCSLNSATRRYFFMLARHSIDNACSTSYNANRLVGHL